MYAPFKFLLFLTQGKLNTAYIDVGSNGTLKDTHSMKLRILVILVFLNFGYQACGQDSVNYHGQPFIIRDLPTKSKKAKPPLFIIKTDNKSFQVLTKGDFINNRKVKKTLKQLNPDWIVSIDVLKGNSATEKYGPLGQHGAVTINLKEGTLDKLPRRLKKRELIERS